MKTENAQWILTGLLIIVGFITIFNVIQNNLMYSIFDLFLCCIVFSCIAFLQKVKTYQIQKEINETEKTRTWSVSRNKL